MKTISMLPNLLWLDDHEVLPKDRVIDPNMTVNPDDLRSAYFIFTVLRVMSVLQPQKADKVLN